VAHDLSPKESAAIEGLKRQHKEALRKGLHKILDFDDWLKFMELKSKKRGGLVGYTERWKTGRKG